MSLIKRICKSRDSINSLSTVHFAEQWRWRGSKSRERGERPGRADLAVTHDAASGSEEEEWQWFAVVRRKTMATIVFPFCVEAQICSFPFFPFVFLLMFLLFCIFMPSSSLFLFCSLPSVFFFYFLFFPLCFPFFFPIFLLSLSFFPYLFVSVFHLIFLFLFQSRPLLFFSSQNSPSLFLFFPQKSSLSSPFFPPLCFLVLPLYL